MPARHWRSVLGEAITPQAPHTTGQPYLRPSRAEKSEEGGQGALWR